MVDELLRGFLDWLFERYQEIVATEPNPLERLKGLFMASFEAIEHRHAQVVIYQDEAKRLSGQPRFSYVEERNKEQRKMWLDLLNQGVEEGYFRPDIDVDLVYRFIRDTTWVSVRWYQPGGPLTAEQVGRQYLSIVLGGITAENVQRRSSNAGDVSRRTSSTLCGPPSVRGTDRWPACIRSILGAHAFRGLFDRVDVDPGAVDDVIVGCVDAIGGQAGNIGRNAWLAAGYPEEVPGVTVDRQCGSSQQAISFGAQAILSGTADLILAGGMQNMSQIPIASAMVVGKEFGFTSPTNESENWRHRYGDQEISQFRGAELIAERWNISREEMEQFALTSHQRALAAIRGGHFDNEIIPVVGTSASTRARARRRWRRWRRLQAPHRGRPADCGGREPDLRRRQCGAAGLRAGGQGPQADAAGAHPPHQRARRRSGVHADRTDPRDAVCAGEDRPVDRRHRHRRDQRGVRAGGAGLAEGDQGRPGEGQPERRRDRARPSAWARPAPSCSPPCSTSSSAPAAATACRRCARAAAPPTSRSSNGCSALLRERESAQRDDPAGEAADEEVLGDVVDADVAGVSGLSRWR